MPRNKMSFWSYECDALDCGRPTTVEVGSLHVQRGDTCNTSRGTEIHDQADADAHARSIGWQITHGGRQVFCPRCTGKSGGAA